MTEIEDKLVDTVGHMHLPHFSSNETEGKEEDVTRVFIFLHTDPLDLVSPFKNFVFLPKLEFHPS